ncbi:unnamed protein product [Cyclocybe aegerita]|uniref:NAD(P)-binding protein n=1 Tax=Cyclocybe aegerita TaxID=1973307 RepID=A0A8S0VWT8_CYCAE|nr:unnamed protein product [Cyclocybe aegerita]
MSRIILVTGSNTGIGFELVRLLAEKKHVVYLAARNEAAGKEAQQKLVSDSLSTVKFVHLDVNDAASVKAAAQTVSSAEGHLDVLVNNAAISKIEAGQHPASVGLATIREAMETNFYGLIQTTIAFIPLLRKSNNPVILNVSTELASNSYQAREGAHAHFVAYNSSKAAANSYTISLAQELKKDGFKVNAVTPGYTSTKLNNFGQGAKTARAGADSLLPWALLEKDGPTCKFIDDKGKEFPW